MQEHLKTSHHEQKSNLSKNVKTPYEASAARPQSRYLLYVVAFLTTLSGGMWFGSTLAQQLKHTFEGGSFDYSTLLFGILLLVVGRVLFALSRRGRTQP